MRRVARRVWACLRGSPLTFVWLAALAVTTSVQHSLSPEQLDETLGRRSTNLANLDHNPVQVLFSSLFWIDGATWLPYAVAFCLFHVPAERWLGSLRWLAVGLSAHVLATYVSEGVLALAIHEGVRSADMVNTQDVGVSYFLAGVIGVLTYHVARPWRWVYLAGVAVYYGLPLITHINFTVLGHATAALIGLAWYPITRGRGAPWDPRTLWRRRTTAPTGTHTPAQT